MFRLLCWMMGSCAFGRFGLKKTVQGPLTHWCTYKWFNSFLYFFPFVVPWLRLPSLPTAGDVDHIASPVARDDHLGRGSHGSQRTATFLLCISVNRSSSSSSSWLFSFSYVSYALLWHHSTSDTQRTWTYCSCPRSQRERPKRRRNALHFLVPLLAILLLLLLLPSTPSTTTTTTTTSI